MTRALFRIAGVILGVSALLVAGVPVGLYWLALSNIEGRTEPPAGTGNIVAESALLQKDLRMILASDSRWRILRSVSLQIRSLFKVSISAPRCQEIRPVNRPYIKN
jgi:hypothetical protein